jgi:hypothetical protein
MSEITPWWIHFIGITINILALIWMYVEYKKSKKNIK